MDHTGPYTGPVYDDDADDDDDTQTIYWILDYILDHTGPWTILELSYNLLFKYM